jgi:hypothetical protein
MYYATKVLSFIAIFVIAKNRTTTDSVALVLLFNLTLDMGWLIMDMFSKINWFLRLSVQVQRVFNLQDIPQE